MTAVRIFITILLHMWVVLGMRRQSYHGKPFILKATTVKRSPLFEVKALSVDVRLHQSKRAGGTALNPLDPSVTKVDMARPWSLVQRKTSRNTWRIRRESQFSLLSRRERVEIDSIQKKQQPESLNLNVQQQRLLKCASLKAKLQKLSVKQVIKPNTMLFGRAEKTNQNHRNLQKPFKRGHINKYINNSKPLRTTPSHQHLQKSRQCLSN